MNNSNTKTNARDTFKAGDHHNRRARWITRNFYVLSGINGFDLADSQCKASLRLSRQYLDSLRVIDLGNRYARY